MGRAVVRAGLVYAGVRGGGALRAPIFRGAAFDRAAKDVGVGGLHPHEERHTAASLAIASGANVKVVQQMLGHKSAVMTLDQYGHLSPTSSTTWRSGWTQRLKLPYRDKYC